MKKLLFVIPALVLFGCGKEVEVAPPVEVETEVSMEAEAVEVAPTEVVPETPEVGGAEVVESAPPQAEAPVETKKEEPRSHPSTQEKLDVGVKYSPYNAVEFTKLKDSGKKFGVFFHASWCSTCMAWEKSFLQHTMPKDTIVLKADFDKAEKLKKELGVSTQSTFVFFDGKTQKESKLDPTMNYVSAFFEGK